MKFSGNIYNGKGNRCVDFGGNPGHCLDPGIFCYCAYPHVGVGKFIPRSPSEV